MRKTLILLLLNAFVCSALYSGEGYSIKMKITPLKDTVCYLGYYFGDKQYIRDTAKVDKSGNMEFKGKEKLPGGIYLLILPTKRYFEIIVDKEQDFFIETDTNSMVNSMKVKGSKENDLFYHYLKFIADKAKKAEPLRLISDSSKNKDSVDYARKELMKIDNEVKDYKLKYMKENPNTLLAFVFKGSQDPVIPKVPEGEKDSAFWKYIYFKKHYFDNLDLSDDRMLRTPLFHNKLKFYLDKLVVQSPDSLNKELDWLVEQTKGNKETFKYIVYYGTYTYESSQYMGMDAIFVHMANKYYKTGMAYWVDSAKTKKIVDRAKLLEPLLIGKVAPRVQFSDTGLTNKKIYVNHSIKSPFLIMVFYDPECGHCKKEVPKMKEFYDKYKSKGFEIMAVNIESKREPWIKFIEEHKLNWINVSNADHWYNLKDTYDVYSTPVVYILDANKKIIAKRIGAEQLADFAERFLNNPPK